MKKIFTGLFLTASLAFVSAQTISFDKTTIDYGNIEAGADGQRIFTVKNTGDKPLIISNVKASCGCTTPEWSTDPIMPGKTSPIKVGYNTAISGPFAKIIEVYSNDTENSRTVLNIKGSVAPQTEELAASQENSATKAAASTSDKAQKAAPAAARKAKK